MRKVRKLDLNVVVDVTLAVVIMGCAGTRTSAEESTLESRSVSTGIERHSVAEVVGTIRSHSTAGFILPAQLNAIKRALRLNEEEKDKATLQEFYKRFVTVRTDARQQIEAVHPRMDLAQLDNAELIEEEKFLSAAILLSNGPIREKALALYRVYDEGFSNALSETSLTELLRSIFKLASEDFLVLAKLDESEEVKKQLKKVKKYVSKAQSNYDKAVTAALALFKKEALTADAFASTLTAYKNGQLTSPDGLRTFMVEQTPKPEKLAGESKKDKKKKTEAPPAEAPAAKEVEEVKASEAAAETGNPSA